MNSSPPVAHDQVVGAHVGPQGVGDLAQEAVAGDLAVEIVAHLEVVRVDKGEHEGVTGPLRPGNLVLELQQPGVAGDRPRSARPWTTRPARSPTRSGPGGRPPGRTWHGSGRGRRRSDPGGRAPARRSSPDRPGPGRRHAPAPLSPAPPRRHHAPPPARHVRRRGRHAASALRSRAAARSSCASVPGQLRPARAPSPAADGAADRRDRKRGGPAVFVLCARGLDGPHGDGRHGDAGGEKVLVPDR